MRKPMQSLAAIFTVLALAVTGCGGAKATPQGSGTAPAGTSAVATAPQPGQVVNLRPAEVQERLESGENLLVLDVREDWEFKEGHIPGARLIPLGGLADRLSELDPEVPVVVVCRSGNRSAKGAAILAQAGFKAVYNMTGGMNQWRGQVEK